MVSSLCFTDSRIVSAAVFDCIALVMQEFAEAAEAVLLTESSFPSFRVSVKHNVHRFVVAVGSKFSGLLLGRSVQVESPRDGRGLVCAGARSPAAQYHTLLSFEPEAIAAFLTDLQRDFASNHPLIQQLSPATQHLRPNAAHLQTAFSLRLAELMSNLPVAATPNTTPTSELDNPEQPEQDTVLGKVATQIRETQELSLILQTALRQVRSFLQVERVVIYEFETGMNGLGKDPLPLDEVSGKRVVCGRVTYEDRAHESIPRILNLSEGVQCFIEVPNYQEKYRRGAILTVEDVQTTYADAPCLVELLEWAQVRAKLVVPIVLQEELWGLLIAHQCTGTRQWQESEVRFLRCVAELLAIAIYQNQLYSQLQLQAQTLEQRVIERTQELSDAMNAAQSASVSKTEFLATVSHELRTPLTAIIGMSTTLLRLPVDARRERLLPVEKQQEYLRIIRTSGEHLLELINDIIDLSQVEAGRAILDVQEFSLSQVANECLRMLRDKAARNQIKLELDLQVTAHSPRSPESAGVNRDRFAADPKRVKQILLNLLSNAIKFTPEAGRVTLRIWVEQGTAFLQVEDTGIGIPSHKFPLLFQKFQQLEHPYHRKYEGTGLGLALTKQLVELHGGRIEVESVVNVGSTFTVSLPAQPLKTLSDRVERALVTASEFSLGGRVVLIENHEATANLICDLLTAARYQVIWMMEGTTALRQIEIIRPEAVLVDTQLTGMSAGEILHRLRQNPTMQAVNVVLLLSPNATEHDRKLAESADAALFLPLNHPEELLDQVRNAIAAKPRST